MYIFYVPVFKKKLLESRSIIIKYICGDLIWISTVKSVAMVYGNISVHSVHTSWEVYLNVTKESEYHVKKNSYLPNYLLIFT